MLFYLLIFITLGQQFEFGKGGKGIKCYNNWNYFKRFER